MQRDQLVQLLDVARAVDSFTTDRAAIVAAVVANSRLVAWCESQQLAAAQALEKLGAVPASVLAEASRSNLRDSERVVKRANTVKAAPAFSSALACGAIAAGHLDQLGVSLCRLETTQQAKLLADEARLLLIAKNSTSDEFGRALRAEERRLATDDGMPWPSMRFNIACARRKPCFSQQQVHRRSIGDCRSRSRTKCCSIYSTVPTCTPSSCATEL